ncbi:glyceraldehyde-3-phosphate dehydrogenase [Flavobacterium sp. CS20]|uniref:glyceraldehyde-3-phosphate dehydrogenase n=1 Tax=Flavobacterium sp. CS20 TaxID=2775246 RepID=UPI001B3A286C|nr:glyceraldehyde-3-phosphate dehydrogenase [Flavobacterium sp. CS20]QTY26678.1 glyceraldehyde-3-phosphate dehydrogenase [Flavobacterium sp. CS20]
MPTLQHIDIQLSEQAKMSKTVAQLIKIVQDLWFDRAVELVLFRNSLINKSVAEVLDLHHYTRAFVEKPISVFESLNIAEALLEMETPPAKIDLGKLTHEFQHESQDYEDVNDFLVSKLIGIEYHSDITPKDVILYGFGRIGRLLARELMTKTGSGNQLRLRAIVTRGNITDEIIDKRLSLLKNDSIHGEFHGNVVADYENQALVINGTTVYLITSNSPENIDYTQYSIQDALVLDNTGAFRDKEALSRHLKAKGVSKVLLTAPGKGVPNIVHGVNQNQFDLDQHDIFSATSCTTNAITPILKAIEDTFGIENGHLETIHAYTNDQNLVDNMHKKYRRGRALAINMVITETGAGKAVAKALPQLEGKLTSNAIRVPVPNGSLAILNLNLKSEVSLENINKCIKTYALEGELVEQIKYAINNEMVSSDIIGNAKPSIFDSNATISEHPKNCILYVWYDNEYGYSHQVIRLAKHIAKVRRFTYY